MNSLECDDYESVVKLTCGQGDFLFIPVRCKVCPGCKLYRRVCIQNSFIARARREFKVLPTVLLWTLGTDLKTTPENKIIMNKNFAKFRSKFVTWSKRVPSERYMNKFTKNFEVKAWSETYDHKNFLFKVLESGTKGNRLHYHLIHKYNGKADFIPFGAVLSAWRSVFDVDYYNVNFSRVTWGKDKKLYRFKTGTKAYKTKSVVAVKYLTKYLTKGVKNYSHLGYHRKKEEKEHNVCIQHGNPWIVDSLTYRDGEIVPVYK